MNNVEQQAREIVGKYRHTDYAHSMPFSDLEKDIAEALQLKQNEIDEVKIECERLTKILTRIQKNGLAVHEGEELAALEARVEELESQAEQNKSDWATFINYLDPAILSTSSDKDKAYEVMKRVEQALANKE